MNRTSKAKDFYSFNKLFLGKVTTIPMTVFTYAIVTRIPSFFGGTDRFAQLGSQMALHLVPLVAFIIQPKVAMFDTI